jgi:hypothetical protein
MSTSTEAYTADRIFDGDGVLKERAILVSGDTIAGVVPLGALPRGVRLHREKGFTIIPGLIDAHIHFMKWEGPLYLAYGVTTVRDTGNALEWILRCRKVWKNHPWPRILCMGPILDGPKPVHPFVARACTSAANGCTAVRKLAKAGVDGIKLYVGLDPKWFPSMVRASHTAGLKVSAHCSGRGVLKAGRAGVDEFFHLDGILDEVWPNAPGGWIDRWGLPEFRSTMDRQRRVADEIKRLGMVATPTLTYWESQWKVHSRNSPFSKSGYPFPGFLRRCRAVMSSRPFNADRWRRAHEAAQKFVGLLVERDVPVFAGTDVPCGQLSPGVSLWRELELLVEAGLTPECALRAATSDAAGFYGQPRLGRLRAGAAADFLFVRGNPLEKIPAKPDITFVVHNGKAQRPAELRRLYRPAVFPCENDPWGKQFKWHAMRRRS